MLSIKVEITTISCTLGIAILLGACAPAEIEQGEPGESASATRTRLLTGEQYTNSIAAVFGDDIANSVLPPIPPMTRTDGLLSSGAAYVGVT